VAIDDLRRNLLRVSQLNGVRNRETLACAKSERDTIVGVPDGPRVDVADGTCVVDRDQLGSLIRVVVLRNGLAVVVDLLLCVDLLLNLLFGATVGSLTGSSDDRDDEKEPNHGLLAEPSWQIAVE